MADEHESKHDQAHEQAHDAAEGAADVHGAEHAEHGHDPLGPAHLIGHVKDADYFELPRFLGGKIEIPQFYKGKEPIATIKVGFLPIDDRIEPFEGKLTKFMVLEVAAALLLVVVFTWLASRLKRTDRPQGRW